MTDNRPLSPPAGPDAPGDALGDALAAAVRTGVPHGTAGERQALDAFRAARDSGALTAAPRRRDDWRPRHRRVRRPVRVAVGAVLASLTVGGVAVAAIGASSTATDRPDDRPRPGRTASAGVDADRAGADAPHGTATPSHPEQARDDEARCKSYEDGHGTQRVDRAAQGCETPSRTPAPAGQGPGDHTPPGDAAPAARTPAARATQGAADEHGKP
ncbi:hypothetical protein [Streptomyces sp. VRA16 Mangrove soil]|uniref:hypothetical protein n=1 Tax=Streptomyces sp. VRA16 Mangrove soil TaxID=2817434 RepID=UPI001A9E78A3|nr:hypothetical protein [Streptomyces sp. VRA16 Mangrove soil]MBO1334823.1 hypothetical protein [Streptomyces sp. VRA16 Mangrove soil]